MIGLIHWTRSFTYDAKGDIVQNANGPVFSDHPQPNCWNLIAQNAADIASRFDFVQLPPWCEGSGECYTPFNLRSLNSPWGTATQLNAAGKAAQKVDLDLAADYAFRAANGENGGPGVFKYPDGIGNTTPSMFQYRGQPGEAMPPFVQPDDVFDPSGNYPFGRCWAYQHCIPAGSTQANSLDALKTQGKVWIPGIGRIDNGKGTYMPFMLALAKALIAQGTIPYSEVDTGNPQELDAWVREMQYLCGVEDYAQFWNSQRACNQYDARLFNPVSAPGYWRWNNGLAWGFANNPDVATSWNWYSGGTISQQIAFNLLLAYVLNAPLPYRAFLAYIEDYYPASPDFPTGRGFKTFLDNLFWFVREYAFGDFTERWKDKDVYAYTRDGNGGSIGRGGGCLVGVNFNTYNRRIVTMQTHWNEGQRVHNYSCTGHNEDYTIGAGGKLTVEFPANAYSSGQSYLLIAGS